MSPNDMFAAQMWSWPDPLLKRDMQGRILFVNEAFLRLYGGQVHDWHGNTLGGWPAPQANLIPSRFDTRAPGPTHSDGQVGPERIYDWLEYCLNDGGALCIGRDVTDLLAAQPTAPVAPVPQAPLIPDMDINSPSQISTAQVPQAAPPMMASPPPVTVPETSHQIQTQSTPLNSPPLAESTYAPPQAPQPLPLAPPQTPPLSNALMAEPLRAPVPSANPALQPHTSVPAPADMQTTNPNVDAQNSRYAERDHERRALPIESGESVLGNNWRDAVIAKAVGATAETPAETPSPTLASQEGETHRILLAEDNAINALLTRTLLEADGCLVDVVEDGQLAVEAMKTNNYDMIFMDMRMPNMDGLEATRKIRTLPNVPAGLPIVALTANAFDDDRNACFDSGMNDFMTKPVSAEELSEMVKRWAGKDADMKEAC
ncbi:MAG: response regulator [Maricaulaceae bacterium]